MVHQIVIGNLETQPLLHLPAVWAAQFPRHYRAEFREISVSILEMVMVEPKSPARFRRYRIVRHNSGIWTSIPRPWLRDCSARVGDLIEVTWNATTCTLTLRRMSGPGS